MGVKNLWDILESCKKTLPLHHLQNKRVCVDLSCWMVQLQSVNRSYCATKEKVYLRGLFHRLRALIALNCSLIFVTDGAIPGVKLSTYRRRLNAENEVILDAANRCKASSIKRNMGSEFSRMIKEAEVLALALGIPCLNGIEEAEAQCALLNLESLCVSFSKIPTFKTLNFRFFWMCPCPLDGCFTTDSDAFLFGARTVYRDICLGEGGYVVCYEMDDIERFLEFGRNSLISLAVLLGSDYTQGVRGFGLESACQFVKSVGDSAVLQRLALEGLPIVKKKKSSKRKGQTLTSKHEEHFAILKSEFDGNGCNLPTDNHFLEVIDAYLKPKCHSAESDAVCRALSLYPFSRGQLHQICTQFFDWPPEKTDEYILPKIAERDLRRFSNLRSTSSQLGVHLSIDERPVKCPVSSIVKKRISQGRDYFEVTWEDMHGLKASVVPADLVESACPEKILEFHERKAQKKKPKHKSKVEKTVLKEIDDKLQELLLDIERDTNNLYIIGGLVPEEISTSFQVDMLDQITRHSSKLKVNSRGGEGDNGVRSSSDSYATGLSFPEKEINDLMSSSPSVLARGVSEYRDVKCVDVVELSESDNDVSPEHARKARELRLFIARIGDRNS
ncbi:single-strand DNA endonuclease 1 isoform X2 [Henckelia pumila]|uniref:single-strand DNA endonuclease 1 isoform X2 n=1 Tax=Henckelia pumila TaxID=405737 RepID=UPI003C6DC24C